MKYTVRTKEGELQYGSFGEVERAWLMGLVEPDDELLEEGHTKWRRADSYPVLLRARRTGEQAWGGAWFLWAVFAILLGSLALYLLKQGQYLLGLGTAFAVVSVMFSVTRRAFRRAKPPGVR